MADSRTERCVYCLKRKATSWAGFVKEGRKRVMAGWCGAHAKYAEIGFYGLYFTDMGRQYDKKGKWNA